jgi:hypothetical protein
MSKIYEMKDNKIKFKSKIYIKNNIKYYKINRNQLLILDALLYDGGMTKKYLDSHKNIRYSEHAGLLDFDSKKLERIIVSGKTTREDTDDIDILLPHDLPDMPDYEYIFHTHPPTPHPGGRVTQGILYEFPSISDLFHFIYYFNEGFIQGSIVVTAEGLYIIKPKVPLDKKIIIPKNTNKIEKQLTSEQFEIQNEAIIKYGTKFDNNIFFKKIAQDKLYINKFNLILKKYFDNQIVIKYIPREYDIKIDQWIIKKLYLRIRSVEELKKKNNKK